jgi:hypothetical protein
VLVAVEVLVPAALVLLELFLLLPHAASSIAAANRHTANVPYFFIPIPSSEAKKKLLPAHPNHGTHPVATGN